jgi:hypothetical protein
MRRAAPVKAMPRPTTSAGGGDSPNSSHAPTITKIGAKFSSSVALATVVIRLAA